MTAAPERTGLRHGRRSGRRRPRRGRRAARPRRRARRRARRTSGPRPRPASCSRPSPGSTGPSQAAATSASRRPRSVGGARLLAAMAEGKDLGRLDLHVVGGSFALADRGERAEVETILADHRRQLVDYDRRLGDTDPASLRDYYETATARDRGGDRARDGAARAPARGDHGELVRQPAHPARRRHARPDRASRCWSSAYNRESERLAAAGQAGRPRRRARRARPASSAAEPAAPPRSRPLLRWAPPPAADATPPALAFWKTTKHARALGALARIGARPRPVVRRLPRHRLPAAGRPGASTSPAPRLPLANVGCEACHGPGQGHPDGRRQDRGRPRARRPGDVCLGCHTADITNGEFDYPRLAAAIVGPGHGRPGAPARARP